jgi:hypothetical protein
VASHHLRVSSGSVNQRQHLQLVVKPGVAPDAGDGRTAAKADRSLASQSWHRGYPPSIAAQGLTHAHDRQRDHPTSRPYHVLLDGGTMLRDPTRKPLLGGARELLARGVDPQTPLVMRRAGSVTDG